MRRDSGLAPSNSTARESYTTLTTDVESTKSLKKTPSLPRLLADDESSVSSRHKNKKWMGNKGKQAIQEEEVLRAPDPPFRGITTEIPNSSLEDLSSLSQVEFSKRGSMLIGGKKANESNGNMNGHARLQGGRRQPSTSKLVPPSSTFSRVLSADDEMLSQKVRSMYDCRNDTRTIVEEGSPHPVKVASIEESREEGQTPERPLKPTGGALPNGRERSQERNFSRPITRDSREGPTPKRNNSELAGGIEDWDNIEGGEVDRYGFIVPRKPASRDTSSSLRPPSPTPPRIQRVSTLLQLASDAPRRSRSRVGRTPSLKGSTQSGNSPAIMGRRPSKRTLRPASSQGSYTSSIGGHHSRFRLATNRLPHNKDRRCMDEAGDMLTLPPGLADIAEFEGGRASNDLRSREWDREEKWRKMGKVVENGRLGGGMVFEFDTRSPKVIERTWKGIPDRWRASAWHAFLSASARKHRGMPSDAELIQTFNELLDQSSPDDVQIDIDVPRTINSHIMFRRRYRGGQRLLFRVLHCLSIYFPETGYVQGMAALAATLLCYFDEGMTFVMLVRMWQLRGLSKLYQPGFEGLMQGLEEFEKKWLGGGEVASKLVSYPSHRTLDSISIVLFGKPKQAQSETRTIRPSSLLTRIHRPNSASPRQPTEHDGT